MIVWARPWGATFRFVYLESERRAYCLADRGDGTITLYTAHCDRDPVTATAFNVLPWFIEASPVTGDAARDAWASVLARLEPS